MDARTLLSRCLRDRRRARPDHEPRERDLPASAKLDLFPRPAVFGMLLIAALLLVPRVAGAAASSTELEVVDRVNQLRAGVGVAALGTDTRLFDAAEKHSNWMCQAQTMSHTGSGGSSVGTRVTAEGYVWFTVGETIAQGYTSPTSVVQAWRNSPGHWNILRSANFRDIGVGYNRCDGRPLQHFWTVVVANSRNPAIPVGGSGGGGGGAPAPTATPRSSGSSTIIGQVEVEGRGTLAGTEIHLDGRRVTQTDSRGNFRIDGVDSGTHRVLARRAGWLDAQAAFSGVTRGKDLGPTVLRAGDIVVNNRVDYGDFRQLVAYWYRCSGLPARVDIDGDGCVTWSDYRYLAGNYGKLGPTGW